jgi:UDP-N-acetylmuramoyl-tripeptide--D-alanyl-D-alanine ligase
MTYDHLIPWTAQEILAATTGELLCGDRHRQFAEVSIDSRKISPSDVFVAIIGDVHDGHTFLEDVIHQGIYGVVINKKKAKEFPTSDWHNTKVTAIAVEDTTKALGDLAAFHRNRTDASVVAITGSNGKTTTRKLISAVIARQFNTLSAIGNYNNQIGLPLTLLKLQQGHTWAVVELGTNGPGEIARLAEISSPEIGVITNIGPAHLEGLGSLEGVMREKGDLLKHIKSNGKAILNADDRRILKLAEKTDREVILFGLSEDATIRAEAVKEKAGGISFILVLPQERVPVQLSISGQFMVPNALAAAAVGYVVGLSAEQIKVGLEEFCPAPGRMSFFQMPNGIHIIDDTYNANPDSMKAAILALKALRANSRSILIAGDMLELGKQSASMHIHIGKLAATSGIRKIYVAGEFAEAVAKGAQDSQMNGRDIFTGTKDEILKDLKNYLKSGDWVLIKGSRGMAMEDIVNGLKEWAGIKPSA